MTPWATNTVYIYIYIIDRNCDWSYGISGCWPIVPKCQKPAMHGISPVGHLLTMLTMVAEQLFYDYLKPNYNLPSTYINDYTWLHSGVIKHGWLENHPFIDDFPTQTEPFWVGYWGIPSHVWLSGVLPSEIKPVITRSRTPSLRQGSTTRPASRYSFAMARTCAPLVGPSRAPWGSRNSNGWVYATLAEDMIWSL